MNFRTRTAIVAFVVVLLAGLVLAPAAALAVSIGNHNVDFNGYLLNYPSSGQSTWFYTITSNSGGGGPAISHVTFALGGCLTLVDAGTWSGTVPSPVTLNSGAGSPVLASPDPTTGVTGIKFDQGFSSGETRRYYFTVTGALGEGPNTIALKGGPGFVASSVNGPSCDPLSAPLSVVLSDFAAVCEAANPQITWQTLSEAGTQGFNLMRGSSANGWDTQLNSNLIPAQNPGSTTGGGSYQWLDASALPDQAYFYWLQDVSMTGATSMHGPVSVTCLAPTAVGLSSLDANTPASSALTWWAAALAMAGLLLGVIIWQRQAQTR